MSRTKVPSRIPPMIRKGDHGAAVRRLQRLLVERGYPVDVDADFGLQTYNAVRAFQSQNLDQHGQPLVVDGAAGPLTWWSLTHPKPDIEVPSVVDYRRMPAPALGGSSPGRAALAAALAEMAAGACEVGANNCGPWVRKYLHGLAPEPSNWCAGFVSWCYSRAGEPMPFRYTIGARDMLSEFKRRRWAYSPGSGYLPAPGDIVVWWRVRADDWHGHVGLVHQVRDGMLYTIEGNKKSRVDGFSYVLSRMERLLGFGHVP